MEKVHEEITIRSERAMPVKHMEGIPERAPGRVLGSFPHQVFGRIPVRVPGKFSNCVQKIKKKNDGNSSNKSWKKFRRNLIRKKIHRYTFGRILKESLDKTSTRVFERAPDEIAGRILKGIPRRFLGGIPLTTAKENLGRNP